jgi:uncharacterized protein YjiS (DUF1127 family)
MHTLSSFSDRAFEWHRRAFIAVAQWCQHLRAGWRRARELRRAERQFASLDAHALRDMGLHRSELGSYWAEAQRQAPLTRRRVRAGAPAA